MQAPRQQNTKLAAILKDAGLTHSQAAAAVLHIAAENGAGVCGDLRVPEWPSQMLADYFTGPDHA